MPKNLVKPRIFSNKIKQKPKLQKKINISILTPKVHSLKQKLLSENGFVV